MTNLNKKSLLPPAVLVLSIAAYILRRALYATAVDAKNLLLPGHPLEVLLCMVVLFGAALIVFTVRKLDGAQDYEDNFTPSSPAALGHALMGCTVLMMALLYQLPLGGTVSLVWKVLGILCGPAMIWGGFCRMKGRKPFFGIHAAVCLFLLLYLVSRYQDWSGNPQLQDYVFELLALVCLTLFSYQCAAFEVGTGNRRMQLATGLLALLLCGAANLRAQVPALYFSGLIWTATDLCRLDPPPKKDEVESHDPV